MILGNLFSRKQTEITTRSIITLAWPAIVSHAIVMLIGVIDLAFIARLETAALATAATAALAIANNVCSAYANFVEGIRSGTTVLTARYHGAEKTDDVSRVLNMALLWALIIGLCAFAITPFVAHWIFWLIGNQEIEVMGRAYMTTRLMGFPLLLSIFAITGFFRGLKNTFTPFVITVFVCGLNALFDYLFIFGKFGFPKLGLVGAAVGTITAYVLGALISFFLLITNKISREYIKFTLPFNKERMREYIKIGAEIGMYSGFIIFAMFLFAFTFRSLGTQALAVHQIAFQVFLVSYLPPMGFFVASSILIGKLIGEKQFALIPRITFKIFTVCFSFIVTICSVIALFAPQIAHFFSPQDQTVATQVTRIIYLICVTQLFSAVFLVMRGALTAAKDTLFILISGFITGYLIFLSLTYLLGIHLGYGVFGGYVAFLIWMSLDALILTIRFVVFKPYRYSMKQ